MDQIINRVALSGITSLDPDTFYSAGIRLHLDVAPGLWQGVAVREADFRAWVAGLNAEMFHGAHVSVSCSADAIVPGWAYMLVASALSDAVSTVVQGSPQDLELLLTVRALDEKLDLDALRDARVVVKGCGRHPVHPAFHSMLTARLVPVVKSLMFGEPCSTVPVFKRSKD